MVSSNDIWYGLLGLVGYQALYKLAQLIVRWRFPQTYAKLQHSGRQQFRTYFVFLVGWLMTASTTPICMTAFVSTDTGVDKVEIPRALSPQERLCLGSRAVLWISETPLFRHSSAFATHHVLSLVSLAMVMLNNLPLRPLFLIYSGLVTELASDTLAILRMHGLDQTNSRLYSITALMNSLGIMFLRAVPALVFTAWYLQPITLTRPIMVAYMASVVFYSGYLMYASSKQLSALGYVQLNLSRPATVRLGNLHLSIFSLFLGSAIGLSQLATVAAYCFSQELSLDYNQISTLAGYQIGTVVVGLLGAKYVNNRMVVSSPCPSTVAQVRKQILAYSSLQGICIQGGLLYSTMYVLLGSRFVTSIDTSSLVSSMALSLPLGEAVGRIGCYFGGCCGSKRPKDKTPNYPAVQLLACVMNMAAFCFLASALAVNRLEVPTAGISALGLNAAVRLTINPLREDLKTVKAATNRFAICQLLTATGLMMAVGRSTGISVATVVVISIASSAGILLCCWSFARLWLILTPSVPRSIKSLVKKSPWLGRPITYVYLFSVCIVAVVAFNWQTTTNLHNSSQAVEYDLIQFPHYTRLLYCGLIAGLLPVLAMSKWSSGSQTKTESG